MWFCQRYFWRWNRSQGIRRDHPQRDACILPDMAHIFHRHEKMLSVTPEFCHRMFPFDKFQGDMAPLLCLCNDLRSPLLVRPIPKDRSDPLRHMRSVEVIWKILGNTIQGHKSRSIPCYPDLRWIHSDPKDMVEEYPQKHKNPREQFADLALLCSCPQWKSIRLVLSLAGLILHHRRLLYGHRELES